MNEPEDRLVELVVERCELELKLRRLSCEIQQQNRRLKQKRQGKSY